MALTIAVPGVASATGDENPLSEIPPQYEPALEAVAAELGVSADSLQSASREELQTMLCSELEGESAEEAAARVKSALADIPDSELEGVSEVEREAIESQLPEIVSEVKTACEESGVSDTEETDDSAEEADESDDDVPTPNRVDAGGGGNEASTSAPLVFGGIFAGLFGLFGVAIIGMRRRA